MNREQYMTCIRDLAKEMHAAEASRDPDRILGTAMAVEAFLSGVKTPEEELTPKDQDKPTECPRCAHPWSDHVAGHGCTARIDLGFGDGATGPECECSRTPEALTPKRT